MSRKQANIAVVALGSNIQPQDNVVSALAALQNLGRLVRKSAFIRTKPLGFTDQDDFLNGAVLLDTTLDVEELRQGLKQIEQALGRVRTANKNGPRTIDLDIVIFNNKVIDPEALQRDFVRQSLLELEVQL